MAMQNTDIKLDMATNRHGSARVDFRIVELGPLGDETIWPDRNSSRPHVVHSKIAAGTVIPPSTQGSRYAAYVVAGSATVDGRSLKPGDLIVAPPWARQGEFVAGPDGYEEFSVFNTGDGVYPRLPSTVDEADVLKELFGIETAPSGEIPAAEGERSYHLDNDKNRFETPYYSSKLWESGPLEWIDSSVVGTTAPEILGSPNPFFSQTFVPADGALWPDHRHEGWTFLYILDGWYEDDSTRLVPGDMWITSPAHIFEKGLRPGVEGVSEIAIFENGVAVDPIVIDTTDELTDAFESTLRP
jgi:hypothetical protein